MKVFPKNKVLEKNKRFPKLTMKLLPKNKAFPKQPTIAFQDIIDKELAHIPKGAYLPQGILRMCYQLERSKSLGKNAVPTLMQMMGKGPGEILRKFIAMIEKDHGPLDFQYDREFFGETSILATK